MSSTNPSATPLSNPLSGNGNGNNPGNGEGGGLAGQQFPKAILYSWKTSVWATVPLLALHEKGYSEDEYVVKQVDITKGENFSPSYLKINANGTVPTLVVPTFDTTSPEIASRYRSLRDTMTIAEFLDHARNVNTSNTSSSLPAPALAPATIEGKSLSDQLTSIVHLPTVDPNFLFLSARSPAELKSKLSSPAGNFIRDRQNALQKYISEAEHNAAQKSQLAGPGADSFEQKTVAFLKEKLFANQLLHAIYEGKAGEEREQGFFEASRKAWGESLPDVLDKLEASMKGVYALGDHVCLADLHVISWLARLVEISGGAIDPSGIDSVAKSIGKEGYVIGEKVKAFWAAWTGRESFRKVYTEAFVVNGI